MTLARFYAWGLDKSAIMELRYIQRRCEMRTMKVSPGLYDAVKELADTGDQPLHKVTDDLLTAGLKQLKHLGSITEVVEEDRTLDVREVNGVVYYCNECQHPVDPKKELSECPNCKAELDWGEQKQGLGIVGWGLVGLALLLTLGATRSNRV